MILSKVVKPSVGDYRIKKTRNIFPWTFEYSETVEGRKETTRHTFFFEQFFVLQFCFFEGEWSNINYFCEKMKNFDQKQDKILIRKQITNFLEEPPNHFSGFDHNMRRMNHTKKDVWEYLSENGLIDDIPNSFMS